MLKTSNEVVDVFEENNEADFIRMIGPDLRYMTDEERVHWVFEDVRKYVLTYSSFDRIPVVITDKYDDMGRREVRIPIFKGRDSINNVKEIELKIYFGPPNLFPLTKITGYELVKNKLHE
ncbi:hypothetical protein [Chitinophaga sp. S165]|uniref:hypothetical protein n=1 Tax=Chitinophaga sp. S165 TaxID=2135462 RepID=UPI000D70B1B4|nr:hypothetical protein [Chitinophaga sp. S165]